MAPTPDGGSAVERAAFRAFKSRDLGVPGEYTNAYKDKLTSTSKTSPDVTRLYRVAVPLPQGWGNNEIFYPKPGELEDVARSVELAKRKKQKLNAFEATAICANDLLSSPLYVVGLVTFTAGKLAPVALLMVSGVLYLFKGMYGEAISALPLDGGAFNILMNTSTKVRPSHS